MKPIGACAAGVIAAVCAVAMVWGQDSTEAPPKAAGPATAKGVEVKVTRIQENRSKEFGQDNMGGMSNTQVSLGVTGDPAAKTLKYGKLKIDKAVDDKGTEISWKDSMFSQDLIEGFVSTEKSFGPKMENGFAFDVSLGLTKREASKITQLKGSFLIMSGGKKASVTVPDVASLAGKVLPDAQLKAAHVAIKIESVKGNTVTYTMTGSLEALLEVAMVGADGQTVNTSNGSSSMNGGPKTYTMDANPMPDKAGIKVTLITGATVMTVPFDLKDIPLP